MAFVFRAKRDLKLSNLEQNNLSSGEFHQEIPLIKNIEKQSSEFESKSPRNPVTYKFNTPGPGSYEKNYFNQDIFSKFNQNKKPKNIIEKIKMSVIPYEIQDFIEKYQSIAFNSRTKRFDYKNEDLEKEKPGPGAYYPEVDYSNAKNNFKNNSLKNNNININNNKGSTKDINNLFHKSFQKSLYNDMNKIRHKNLKARNSLDKSHLFSRNNLKLNSLVKKKKNLDSYSSSYKLSVNENLSDSD